jgi:hypothetical protein
LTGALYGEASVRQHQPLMLDTAYDVGSWAGRALDYALYDRPFSPFTRFTFESDTTGIEVRYRGSRGQSTIDYLDELLALAQDQTNQWTISRAYRSYGTLDAPRPRHYYIRAKSPDYDTAIQQNVVYMGGYGIAVSLSQDVTEAPNAIYGEGVHPVGTSDLSGSRWRNSVYPMLGGTVPTYPDRISGADYPITTGDTDGLFTTDVLTQLTSQLRLGGYPDVTIGTVFTSTVGSAIVDWKQDIDYANSNANIGGTAEWAKLFESGTGYTDLSSGWFKPLAWDRAVSKYIYTASGDVAGTAADYDPNILRVETTISYGENVPKKRARINAQRLTFTGTVPVTGTITLTSDPEDGPGLTGRSRFDIREGGWLYLDNWTGGNTSIQFYIAGVTHSPEAFTTTLTVSTIPFDLLDLSTRLERNRSAKTDPAKSFYSQRTSTTRPFRSAVGWDAESGAGTVPRFSAAGSAWTVQRFIGAQYGQIGALLVNTAPDAAYCFAVFGGSVSSEFLDALVPAPLGSVTGDYPSHWQHPDNLDALGTAGFIEAWGSLGEAAGYYPGAESIGAGTAAGSVTGRLEDAGSWSFASYEPPWLWAAIWPRTSVTKVAADLRIIQDEG